MKEYLRGRVGVVARGHLGAGRTGFVSGHPTPVRVDVAQAAYVPSDNQA